MYILFDIGATKMRFARSRDLLHFDEPIVVSNARNYMTDMAAIKEALEKVIGNEKVHGMAGGIAGTFDTERGVLTHSPNFPDWVGKPIARDMQRFTGVMPQFYNDADVAGMGEALFGAGHGFRSVAYMTVSTGVGGALVVDGKPLIGMFSPEPGWQVINYKTKETLHELAAGKDLEEKHGMHPKYLSKQVYKEVAGHLSVALFNAIMLWAPEVFVMGGSQMNDIQISDLEEGVAALNKRNLPMPKIVKAKLGDQNGLFGAMAALRNK